MFPHPKLITSGNIRVTPRSLHVCMCAQGMCVSPCVILYLCVHVFAYVLCIDGGGGLYFIVNKVPSLLEPIKLCLPSKSVLYYTFQSLQSLDNKFPQGRSCAQCLENEIQPSTTEDKGAMETSGESLRVCSRARDTLTCQLVTRVLTVPVINMFPSASQTPWLCSEQHGPKTKAYLLNFCFGLDSCCRDRIASFI